MASLFGYTNPDILSRYPKEIKDEYYQVGYSVPWLQSMENFKETKEKFGEYPKVNKTVIQNEFNDFPINDVAANFQPMARLNNSFYNGLATDDKHYSYGQQVYIPESYPNHYYNTNMFSPLFLAMSKEKKEEDMLDS
jgi:hypothetical protein